jgi:hypothetical protein
LNFYGNLSPASFYSATSLEDFLPKDCWVSFKQYFSVRIFYIIRYYLTVNRHFP